MSNQNKPQTTNHTPGPWKAQGSHVIQGGPREAWQFIVAILPTQSDPRPTLDASAKDIAEREANARLIAAAPALLAALESIADGLANSTPIDYKRDCFESLQIARAALALATGGKQ